MKTAIIEKVETLNEYQLNVTNEFLTNLTKKTELPEIFKNKLLEIKSTPMEEEKINAKRGEILARGDVSQLDYALELVEAVYTIEELDKINEDKELALKELVQFGIEIDNKVFGLKTIVDGVGVYKEIESQNELKPLSYSAKKKIRDLSGKTRKLMDKLQNENNVEKVTTMLDEVKALNEEFTKAISSSHNLNETNMTQWEKDLLVSKLVAHSMDNYTPPLGKK